MRIYDSVKDRCRALGEYLAENGTTVRECAKHFGISKSTVHKDIRERLKDYDAELYRTASEILDRNKRERHIRGGIATRDKYRRIKRKKEEQNDRSTEQRRDKR